MKGLKMELELDSLSNIFLYTSIITVVWIVINSIYMVIDDSFDIYKLIVTSCIFCVLIFCLNCAFSWKKLKDKA